MNAINRVFFNILKPIKGINMGGGVEAVAEKIHVPPMLDILTFNGAIQKAIDSLPEQGTISSRADLIRIFGKISVDPPSIHETSTVFRDDLISVSGWNASKVTDSRVSNIITKVKTLPKHFRDQAQIVIDKIEGHRKEYGGLENATATAYGQALLDIVAASEKYNLW